MLAAVAPTQTEQERWSSDGYVLLVLGQLEMI
jgi:hypothetical protein